MANLRGVNIQTGKIGANTLGSEDGIAGFIIEAPAPAGLAHDTATPLFNLKDAESLGITEEFDKTNFVNCYRHIREYYRLAGEGNKLHIMLTAQDTTMVSMLSDSAPDADDSLAKTLLVQAEGEIKLLGLATNPTIAPVLLNGMNSDSYNAIALSDALRIWADQKDMPINVFMEGRDYSGASAAAADLRDLPNLDALHSTMVIGQDWTFSESLPEDNGAANPVYMRNFADVGTALGVVSSAAVNQSFAENESFNLTDATVNAWMIAGLSNHVKIKDQFSDLQTLEDKGYVFGLTYTGLSGVRFNGDHTCSEIVIDGQGNINAHTVGYGRTINKAKRELRKAYLPQLKKVVPLDPAMGKIATGPRKNLDGIGDTVFGDMIRNSEITDGKTFVDPDSDLLGEKKLKLAFRVVPYGYLNEFEGEINLRQTI